MSDPTDFDREHFARARTTSVEPADQAVIAHPRLGVLFDAQTDLELVAILADARPRWQLVLLPTGAPTESLQNATILRRPNVHLLSSKTFTELPDYIAGWDVALLPHGRKAILELLAAGREVVTTTAFPGGEEFVRVGRTMAGLVGEIERALDAWDPGRRARIDAFLDGVLGGRVVRPDGGMLRAFDGRR